FFYVSSFFFTSYDPCPPHIYTLSLHDALPILRAAASNSCVIPGWSAPPTGAPGGITHPFQMALLRRSTQISFTSPTCTGTTFTADRKSTRLNSSHLGISYAVFCLKKKKKYLI